MATVPCLRYNRTDQAGTTLWVHQTGIGLRVTTFYRGHGVTSETHKHTHNIHSKYNNDNNNVFILRGHSFDKSLFYEGLKQKMTIMLMLPLVMVLLLMMVEKGGQYFNVQ